MDASIADQVMAILTNFGWVRETPDSPIATKDYGIPQKACAHLTQGKNGTYHLQGVLNSADGDVLDLEYSLPANADPSLLRAHVQGFAFHADRRVENSSVGHYIVSKHKR